MDIYFVRHGQTGGNTAKRHQQEDTHLTSLGRKQATTVAKSVADIEPTHLIVSSRVRTLETGQAIAHTTGLVPETSELFVELCRPKYIYGYKHRSLKSVRYLLKWFTGRAGGEACDENGESYATFRARIKEAKVYLEQLPADARVVVVSHSVFINLFLVHMNDTKPLSFLRALWCFKNILSIKNGSLTHVRCHPKVSGICDWSVVSYNNTAHKVT